MLKQRGILYSLFCEYLYEKKRDTDSLKDMLATNVISVQVFQKDLCKNLAEQKNIATK